MSSNETYFVVRNVEEQYSIWRSDKPVPPGWEVVGSPMAKDDCLKAIETLWTDMRPASLRRCQSSVSGAL